MISLIVAYDRNRCIGDNNTIPWKMKSDMIRVKKLTTNQTILMGRKTFESIGKALPNRINRVLTTDNDYIKDNIEIYSDRNKAIENLITDKLFIFGGSKVYEEYINEVEELYITEIDAEVLGDSYFPEINLQEWQLIEEQNFSKDQDNEYNYKFLHYKRLEVK